MKTRRLLPALLATLLMTAGCITVDNRKCAQAEGHDLHEYLSDIMRKHGYTHEIVSSRTPQDETDSVSVSISMDALKRRNRTLETMLREIGALCRRAEFADVPITFWFFSDDSAAGEYVEEILNQSIGANRSWVMEHDSKLERELKSRLVIRMKHAAIKSPYLPKENK